MRLCREQAKNQARMGSQLALDARASRLERAGTTGRRARAIDLEEHLPLRILHLRSVLASTPRSGLVHVASQNYRSFPTQKPLLGLRPSSTPSRNHSGRELNISPLLLSSYKKSFPKQ